MKTNYTLLLLLVTFTSFSQSWQWGKRLGSDSTPGTNQFEEIISLQIDAQGNTYVLAKVGIDNLDVDGHALTTYGGENDYVLASLACNGTYRWATTIGGPGNDRCYDMRIDGNGDVYLGVSPTYATQFEEVFHFDATTTIPYSTQNKKSIYLAKYNGLTGTVI